MRSLVPLLLLPLLAVAAPVPKDKLTPAERLKRDWGTAVLPDDRCSATVDGGTLTLATPGGLRPELMPTAAKNGTGVRSEWPTAGDFEATVKLVSTTEPSHAAPRRGTDARICSGLYVIGKDQRDDIETLWLGRRLRADEDPPGKKLFDFAVWVQHGGMGSRAGDAKPTDAVWVRITRAGPKWSCGMSTDGIKWDRWKIESPDMGDGVTVGVFLTHDVDQKCEAVFADFQVGPPPK